MNRNEIKEFAVDYISYLLTAQEYVDKFEANLCYGGFVYEDTRIDLYELFDNEVIYEDDFHWSDIGEVVDECSSNIGTIRGYLTERNEDGLIWDDEELIAYIQMPEAIWDALYWGKGDATIVHLAEEFKNFIDEHGMFYTLTEYGRNAMLVYLDKDK